MTIIERILKTAEEKNIKQVEIANLIGKGTAQITSWKKRGCNPPAEYIADIAKLLNVSIDYIITGEEPKESPEEQELLNQYRKLTKDNQKDIIDYINFKLNNQKTNIRK